jgi:hypothetical protein
MKLFLIFICCIQFNSCIIYRIFENKYQTDADIIRTQHFDYYAQLLTEYYEKNGIYPFQYEKDEPFYVFILTGIQEQGFPERLSYNQRNDFFLFKELSDGLGRKIDERYDPQKVGTEGRPNMYVYMVHGNKFYFTIHLYYKNHFTKNISRYYNTMVLSNEDNNEEKFYSYKTLRNDPQYLELLNRKTDKQDYFDNLN